MPTRKRSKRKPEQPKKKANTPEMKVIKEKPGPETKSDFIDVVPKQDEPKPILEDKITSHRVRTKPTVEDEEIADSVIKNIPPSQRDFHSPINTTDHKAGPPHYISERIIGNDQLANIADTFNKRFEVGYRFKALIPLRGNESIAIYEKIKTIEFKQQGSTIWGAGGPDDTGSKRYDPK